MPERESAPAASAKNRDASVLRNVDERVAEAHQEIRGKRNKARQVRERSGLDPGFRVCGELPPGDGDQRRIGIEPEAGKTRDRERLELRSGPAPAINDGARAPVIHQGNEQGALAPATPGTGRRRPG